MKTYWFHFARDGGLPVSFPALARRARRFRWQGLYGVQIGPWFIGAIKGSVDERSAAAGVPVRGEEG